VNRARRSQVRQADLTSRTGGPTGTTGAAELPGRVPADAADEPFVPDRAIRSLGWPLVGAGVGLAGLLLAGVPLWRSVILAVSAGIVLFLVVRSMAAELPEWPYDVTLEPYRPFTAWEVAGLEGSREKGPTFHRQVRPRLADLARELLHRRGIDPDSSQAAAVLGPELHALLLGDDLEVQPDSAAISRLCLAIARIAVDPIPGSTAPVRDPALAGLTGRQARRIGAS
jgi:hypothetical protein